MLQPPAAELPRPPEACDAGLGCFATHCSGPQTVDPPAPLPPESLIWEEAKAYTVAAAIDYLVAQVAQTQADLDSLRGSRVPAG